MNNTRDFTATVVIVYKNTVLFLFHKKLGFWLPPGGHIDPNELPDEAAKREVKEETGLDVEFYNTDRGIEIDDIPVLMRPMHIFLEPISPGHEHIDLIYYATTSDPTINPGTNESTEVRWCTKEELKDLQMPPNARYVAHEALRILGKSTNGK